MSKPMSRDRDNPTDENRTGPPAVAIRRRRRVTDPAREVRVVLLRCSRETRGVTPGHQMTVDGLAGEAVGLVEFAAAIQLYWRTVNGRPPDVGAAHGSPSTTPSRRG
ncbi:MAG TPA: hypothetical protein VNO33_20455 [Kofleriaceae bacterium]|nr:hypothetical protein [Kofleriaceae bacterium]